MAGVSTFLGFLLYKSDLKISELSTNIKQLETKINQEYQTKITHIIVDEDKQLSWETISKNRELLLKIKGIDQNEKQREKICVLLVNNIENQDNENELSPNSDQRIKNDDCQKPSREIPKKDGIWELEYTFPDQNYQIIRVETIYKDNRILVKLFKIKSDGSSVKNLPR